ncbi:hypothetical protein B0G83_110226 [Paraburkholderia sp. BL21I4N1]|nr:hypothetical protein B0G83_110226 [Paraburkholderia sp. BL21I4N1]
MNTMRLDYPIAVLCRAFKVSRSGFYAWSNRLVKYLVYWSSGTKV